MTRTHLAALGLSAVAAVGLTVTATGGLASAAPVPTRAPALPSAATLTSATGSRPSATSAAPRSRTHRSSRVGHRRLYTVQPGDSFWSIAAAHRVDWYNLAADNGLTMYDVLDAGQVLKLPAPGEAPHAPMPLQAGASTSAAATATTSASTAPTTTAAPAPVAVSDGGGFEQCVISRESGGNPDASNGAGYWGLFQFSAATWAAYGGNPGDFGSASAGEQQQVFDNAMAAGGESNWAPYDGC